MSKGTRRKYTREFKEEAVKLVTAQGYRVTEAARNLGVDVNTLGRWKRDIVGGTGPVGSADMQSELVRLRKENKRLLMEREILKKAAAFFAKELD